MTGQKNFSNMVTMKRKSPEEIALIKAWEKKLHDLGLSMDAGRDPGHRKLIRVGNSKDLELIRGAQVSDVGRVKPKGAGADSDSDE